MLTIRHKIGIKESKEKIFNAISTEEGLSGWWTQDTQADGHDVGGNIRFSFTKRLDKEYDVLVKIAELNSNRVVWRVVEGPEEWMNTEITFDLNPKEEEVVLYFTHKNWSNPTDFMAQCNTKWAVFLLSLKDLVEKGSGRPFPNDIRISHSGA
jgi:uncharacterized protein YndB with AHSA1/START domain